MTVYRCSVCDPEYDEKREDVTWDQVSDDWACHVCESGKSLFRPVDDGRSGSGSTAAVTGPAAVQAPPVLHLNLSKPRPPFPPCLPCTGSASFLRVSTEELKDFARLTGNDDVTSCPSPIRKYPTILRLNTYKLH